MTTIFPWRDHIQVHPAADLFPRMSESELNELAEDIRRNGLQQPVVVACFRQVDDSLKYLLLDGVNRMDALARLGWITEPHTRSKGQRHSLRHDLPVIVNDTEAVRSALRSETNGTYYRLVGAREGDEDSERELYDLALSYNAIRRHLTSEQKRDVIAKLLKLQPQTSDRTIAKSVKVDNKTVAAVRSDMVRREEIPHVETRTDTKGRKQPAKRKPPITDDKVKKSKKQRPSMLSGPIQEPCKDCTTEEQRWHYSLSNVAGDAISLRAFWKQQFGDWSSFRVTSELVTLARQAAEEWSAIAGELAAKTKRGDYPDPVQRETNRFHSELCEWVRDFPRRLRAWSKSNELPDGAKDCLHNALMLAGNELMLLAQEIDGRGTADEVDAEAA